ncbi:MAG: hypothetical protein CRN43_19280 [Candidatus Nephrothrix sp. EaCA]|nr:MAG: hypothetical protein CRN43_19280 [Candidatus Nephrothrix sp. EaCA]
MNNSALFFKWFGAVMAILYIAFGIWLIGFSQNSFAWSQSVRFGVGGLAVVYGIFRMFTTYNRYFKS